jgi:hypothetical protein
MKYLLYFKDSKIDQISDSLEGEGTCLHASTLPSFCFLVFHHVSTYTFQFSLIMMIHTHTRAHTHTYVLLWSPSINGLLWSSDPPRLCLTNNWNYCEPLHLALTLTLSWFRLISFLGILEIFQVIKFRWHIYEESITERIALCRMLHEELLRAISLTTGDDKLIHLKKPVLNGCIL